KCLLGENGKISLTSNGGSPPYHYAWNISQALDTSVLENVKFGVYSTVIYDALGCKFSLGSILLPYINSPLDVDIGIIQKNVCSGDTKGSLHAMVLQGSGPFDFNWSNGLQHIIEAEADTLSYLPAGSYSVTVTDKEGCVGTSQNITLPHIQAISYLLEQWLQNTC